MGEQERPVPLFDIGDTVTRLDYEEMDKRKQYYSPLNKYFYAMSKETINGTEKVQTVQDVGFDGGNINEYRYYLDSEWWFYESMLDCSSASKEDLNPDTSEINELLEGYRVV